METLNDFIEFLREHRMVVLIVLVSFWAVVAIVFIVRKYFLSKNKKNKDRVGKTKNLIILAPVNNTGCKITPINFLKRTKRFY